MTALITATELHELGAAVALFDATVILETARFDGDYRAVSGRAQWMSGRIPGAMHVDLLTTLRDGTQSAHFPVPTAAQVADLLAEMGVGPGRSIVIYDNGGDLWAARLWWSFAAVGVRALLFSGGVGSWVDAGFPVESGPAPAAADSAARRDSRSIPGVKPRGLPGFWADKRDVLDTVAGRRPDALICALDPASFDGTRPTRYSRRGHIPGSANVPARGRLVVDSPTIEEPVIVYCGGGISACLLAFALREGGYTRVAVYSGSLEEWSADPALPLVTT